MDEEESLLPFVIFSPLYGRELPFIQHYTILYNMYLKKKKKSKARVKEKKF